MKENTLNKILIVCCLLGIMSCKARKQLIKTDTTATATTVTTPQKPTNNVEAKLGPIRAQQISFNTFSGKAKTNLDINGSSNDCTLTIRISNNKKIWVSVTALLGIEVARAQITPDSIFVINRLEGVYLKKPFSFIYNYANKQVNYAMLQALLVGNAMPSLLNDSTQYEEVNNNINLSGNLQDVIYKLILGSDFKVTQTNLSDQSQGQSLQINYDNVMASGSQKMPSQIAISSTAKNNKVQVNIHYIRVDFNQPQDYPFTIPEDYTSAN
jgi:hypothetical protein